MDAVTLAMIKALGGSGSSLPSVTSADNGKVLGVVDGEWAASEQGKKFIVTATPTSPDYSGTMDKTVAEINAAYEAGQEIWFTLSDYTAPCAVVVAGTVYPRFFANVFDLRTNTLIMAYTTNDTDGTDTSYGVTVYSLTPAS